MTEKRRLNKHYPEEFKQDAVSLVLEQGYTVKQAAEAVGVDTKLIYKRIKLFKFFQNFFTDNISLYRWPTRLFLSC